jgi:hypothetical protein
MSRALIFALASAALLVGCEPAVPTSDQKMNAAQEAMSNEAVMNVGMPAISNWQEKRMAKSILEARDRTIGTTTYVMAENSGQMFKLCDSVGYGLPYATQFTNAMKLVTSGYDHGWAVTIPQADPNGLFSPAQADATWVFCVDPETKKDKPVYVEPKVIVSPFPLALTPVEFGKGKP